MTSSLPRQTASFLILNLDRGVMKNSSNRVETLVVIGEIFLEVSPIKISTVFDENSSTHIKI